MVLLILESIGTSELILIGIVALIFLGPRKLPQIAKTIGKMMAEFRTTTNEFKETWQREVDFEEEIKAIRTVDDDDAEPATVPRLEPVRDSANTIAPPEIKPVQTDLFAGIQQQPESHAEPRNDAAAANKEEEDLSDKRNWL
jgi:Tat protein translocase TatB subunit